MAEASLFHSMAGEYSRPISYRGENMKRICVFLGSGSGRGEVYKNAAKELVGELINRKMGLVYGGASVGLMNVLAEAMMNSGGEVIGIMPRDMAEKEIARRDISEFIFVENMFERKKKMAELADGFIALPGGLGTLDEFFEVLTWAQFGWHEKPSGLLDVNGYYAGLVECLDKMREEGFVSPQHREMILYDQSPPGLLDQFDRYRPPAGKWVTGMKTTIGFGS